MSDLSIVHLRFLSLSPENVLTNLPEDVLLEVCLENCEGPLPLATGHLLLLV